MQPVMKISKSRKRKRRSHHALRPIHYVAVRSAATPSFRTAPAITAAMSIQNWRCRWKLNRPEFRSLALILPIEGECRCELRWM